MYTNNSFPKISFGVIVLNGEPFTKYCLRQLYPHAYEIIVVDGGSRKAQAISRNGHSNDGTLQSIEEFKLNEDINDKVKVISKNDFWLEKDEQSQAYAAQATGDYLWQVDIDEFYRDEDIEKIKRLLADNPNIDTVSFKQLAFWGSPDFIADSFSQRSDGWDQYHRLFKWGPGYTYATHRPPTVIDPKGMNLREKNWVNGYQTAKMGIVLYHYSLLLPTQVKNKCIYYSTQSETTKKGYSERASSWYQNCYLKLNHPFRVHNVYKSLSWLKIYTGDHPEEAMAMWNNLKAEGKIELRNNTDAEALLRNPYYRLLSTLFERFAILFRHQPFHFFRRVFIVLTELLSFKFS